MKYCWVFPHIFSSYQIPTTGYPFSVSPLAPGTYSNAHEIHVCPCVLPLTPVSTSATEATIFEACNDIVLDAGSAYFLADPINGGYFLAQITGNCQEYHPTLCEKAVVDTGGGGGRPGTPSGDGDIDETYQMVRSGNNGDYGISNFVSENGVDIYPNPFESSITILFPCHSAGRLEISIKDVSGRVRYTETVSCEQGGNVRHSIDAGTLDAGVYFIDLTLNDQHVVKKIVKL